MDQPCRQLLQVTYDTQDDHFSMRQHRYPLREQDETGRQGTGLRPGSQQQSDGRGPLEQHAGMGLSVDRQRLCSHSHRLPDHQWRLGAGRCRVRRLCHVEQPSLSGRGHLSLGARRQPPAESRSRFHLQHSRLAPYWRVAWQQLTGKTQYEIGTYGMHMRTPASDRDHRASRIRTPTWPSTRRSTGPCSEPTCFRSEAPTFTKIPTCWPACMPGSGGIWLRTI